MDKGIKTLLITSIILLVIVLGVIGFNDYRNDNENESEISRVKDCWFALPEDYPNITFSLEPKVLVCRFYENYCTCDYEPEEVRKR